MSAVYPKFCEQLLAWALAGGVPASLVFKCVGVSGTYVYDAAHNDIADVTGITAAAVTLTTVTNVNGVIDADDVTFTGVTAGQTLDAVIIYLDNGVNSYLAAYIDSAADGSIPQNYPSTEAVVRFNASGIFQV